jgi:KR domain/Zinc-binding dehydrogenase
LLDFENNPTPRAFALWQETEKMIHAGSIRPVEPIQLFAMSEVEKAFRFMQTGKHMGKIVVRVEANDAVPAIPRMPYIGIHADATYVIAGLGGICRDIGRWLAAKGAKHLILLSRSAFSSETNKNFASELRETYGVDTIAYDCDVANKAALQEILRKPEVRSLPSIKGCVTGAMVLHVSTRDG